MNTLNTVPKTGTFGASVDAINANFTLMQEAVAEVAGVASKGKGAYASVSALTAAYPTGVEGDWALVYNSTSGGYDVYTYTNSAWTQGGVFDDNVLSGIIAQAEAAIDEAEQDAIDHISEYGGVEVVQETGESTTAVMSQKAVKDELEPSEEYSLIRSATGRYGISSDGSTGTNVNWKNTGYLDIENVSRIEVLTDEFQFSYYGFYDSSKNPIGTFTQGDRNLHTIPSSQFPSGAKYFRCGRYDSSSYPFSLTLFATSSSNGSLSDLRSTIYGEISYIKAYHNVTIAGRIDTDGSDITGGGFKRTDFISLADADSIYYSFDSNTTYNFIFFYDSERNFIESNIYWGLTGDNYLHKPFFPSNAAYVRFSYQTTSITGTIALCYANNSSDSLIAKVDALTQSSVIGKFAGKKIAIIGDSISTFNGWLPSSVSGYTGSTYATHYPNGDVSSVDKTWWYQMAQQLGLTIGDGTSTGDDTDINNCSWSGSQVTGDSTQTSSDTAGSYGYCGCSTKRIADLAIRGWNPDIVIIFLGCNDWGRKAVNLGTWSVDDAIPSEGTISTFREGYALMLAKIQTAYPKARIFCCTNLEDTQRDADSAWPSKHTNGSIHTWNESIREIASALACDVIEMHNCGINYFNAPSMTADGIHPNAEAHTWMARKVVSELCAKY